MNRARGLLAAHAVTTIHYLIRKELGTPKAKRTVAAMLRVFGIAPVDGPGKGIAISEQWEKMLSVFYEEIGYDRKTTKPKRETLKALGADWLVPVFWGKK